MDEKERKNMSPTSVARLGERRVLDADKKRAMLLAGGSMKTKHKIDSQEICREVRGKE